MTTGQAAALKASSGGIVAVGVLKLSFSL